MTIWQHSENLLANVPAGRVDTFYSRVGATTRCNFCGHELEAVSDDVSTRLSDYPMPEGLESDTGYVFGVVGSRRLQVQNNPQFVDPIPPWGLFGLEQRSVFRNKTLVERRVRACPVCGWWIAFEEFLEKGDQHVTVRSYGGVGALKNLDLRDLSLPIEEVRAFLAGRYDARFSMDPVLFEETVASVFRDLGFRARTTARSGDGGIDVILESSDGSQIGVQVKRYRGKIQVDQIRELTGALVLKGITRGIFVTTSRFSSGASKVADLSAFRGYPIELIDGDRFLDQLALVQRKSTKRADGNAPWQRSLIQIHQRSREP